MGAYDWPAALGYGAALAWLVVASILVQAVRALASPVGFADYFGLPLAGGAGEGFVRVYGVRAVFLGLYAAERLLQRQTRAVATFAFAAVVMPLGDLWLVAAEGGPALTVARHAAIAAVLLATGWLLAARAPVDGRAA